MRHYALRHQTYKSPLARHVFCRWAPAWLDPTRDWAIPITDGEANNSDLIADAHEVNGEM